MASQYRKPFLKHLAASWAGRFPDWQHGVSRPIFYATREATFSCSRRHAEWGRHYHAVIDFSSKIPGCFTCDLIINDHEGEIEPNLIAWAEDIPTLRVGRYRMGYFMTGRDYWWHLQQESAHSRFFRELLTQQAGGEQGKSLPEIDWYASSYDIPLQEIIAEAEAHFSNAFARDVLPKLGL
jgi:hypothetical protein